MIYFMFTVIFTKLSSTRWYTFIVRFNTEPCHFSRLAFTLLVCTFKYFWKMVKKSEIKGELFLKFTSYISNLHVYPKIKKNIFLQRL